MRYILFTLFLVAVLEGALLVWQNLYWSDLPRRIASNLSNQEGSIAATTPPLFVYSFNSNGVLPEAASDAESWSPYWWLNSGGMLLIADGIGKTVQGELDSLSKWRLAYSRSNPRDTDNGYHPQNIFRLLSRNKRQNVEEEVYFRIRKDNLSSSENRNASNGLLLMSRYKDANNLYYLGMRVDGAAVIKKKINGDYFTLSYKKIFPGNVYNKSSNPNLLPKEEWLGLRSSVENGPNGSVLLTLFMDRGKTGRWEKILTATDNGTIYGGHALTEAGYNGIRTDFMDVEFSGFRLHNL